MNTMAATFFRKSLYSAEPVLTKGVSDIMNNRNLEQEKHFIVDILFVLALFGVFAVSALALVTIGADVYQHTVEDMGVNYESRTAVSYIMEKVRQNDTADSIFLTDLENVPALCMLSEIDG